MTAESAESPRVGVLYSDGSINVMADRLPNGAPRSSEAALEEARRELRRANCGDRPEHLAKLVSIDLKRRDVVELTEEDLG